MEDFNKNLSGLSGMKVRTTSFSPAMEYEKIRRKKRKSEDLGLGSSTPISSSESSSVESGGTFEKRKKFAGKSFQ